MQVVLTVDGRQVTLEAGDLSLLDALRDQLRVFSPKDGCSPQGQCGCCTVLVDGAARVACVTPLRRMAGRSIVTADGLAEPVRSRLVAAFLAEGASQCGFCTPGILCRIAGLGEDPSPEAVGRSLLAHLCRCTGWRSIVAAATSTSAPAAPAGEPRDLLRAGQRATIEGGVAQRVGPHVVAGHGGFAEDEAPGGALVAVPDAAAVGGWALGETLAEARAAAGKIQGRRSGREVTWPVGLPSGTWDLTLQTTWVEPAYLEPDASWCRPGGEPHSPLANGGAFGAKRDSVAPGAARALADRHGRPVRVVLSREDVVRLGPKRPPMAAGVRLDGTGVIRVVRTPGFADAVALVAPGWLVEQVDVPGPPTSVSLRGAGWIEAAVLLAGVRGLLAGGARPNAGPTFPGPTFPGPTAPGPSAPGPSAPGPTAGRTATDPSSERPGHHSATTTIVAPGGGTAEATVVIDSAGRPVSVTVAVTAGIVLDEVVLRSYCIGAAHMALGWVCAEAITVGPDGVVDDLTVRSFGVLRARDTPEVDVHIESSEAAAVNGSDAVFAAVAAAAWLAKGLPDRWPTDRGQW